MSLPVFEMPSAGPALHFAHANGFPPAAYTPLFEHLAPHFNILAHPARPLWDVADLTINIHNIEPRRDGPTGRLHPQDLRSWEPLAGDLVQFCQERGLRGIVGAGHSMGSITTLMAGVRHPELFPMMVLIEPVILPRWFSVAWGITKAAGLMRVVNPLVGTALRRQRSFANPEAMFSHYRPKKVFARFSDAALRAYVAALSRPQPDGRVGLAYAPEWEAQLYAVAPHNAWHWLARVRSRLLIIHGELSDTFYPGTAAVVKRRMPGIAFCQIAGAGHLAPFERPAEVAAAILDFAG